MSDMTISDASTIAKFRFWCQKVLPAVYDDSLSYYELLCKVIDKLNEVIEVANFSQEAWQAVYAEISRVENESKTRDATLQSNLDAVHKELQANLDAVQKDLQEQITSNDKNIDALQKRCTNLEMEVGALKEELKKAYSTMIMYDPTTGRYTNSMNVMRRVLQLLVSSDIAITCAKATADYTVNEFSAAGTCGDIINGSFQYNSNKMPYQTVDSHSLYSFDEIEQKTLDVETLAIPPVALTVKKKK